MASVSAATSSRPSRSHTRSRSHSRSPTTSLTFGYRMNGAGGAAPGGYARAAGGRVTPSGNHLNNSANNSPSTLANATPTATSTPGPSSPPDVPFAEFLRTWGDAQISQWLSDVRLPHLAPVFGQNDITGDILTDIDQAELKEMGVLKVGDRVKIMVAIKALKQRCRNERDLRSRLGGHHTAASSPPAAITSHRAGAHLHNPDVPLTFAESNGALSSLVPLNGHGASSRNRTASLRQHNKVPPPLRLAERTEGLPRAYQAVGTSARTGAANSGVMNPGGGSSISGTPGGGGGGGGGGGSGSSGSGSGSSNLGATPNGTLLPLPQIGGRTGLSPRMGGYDGGPSVPPPQASLPAPPIQNPSLAPSDNSSRSRRNRMATDPGTTVSASAQAGLRDRAPTVSHVQSASSSSSGGGSSGWAAGDFGLPRAPTPGNLGSGPTRKASNSNISVAGATTSSNVHLPALKMPSTGTGAVGGVGLGSGVGAGAGAGAGGPGAGPSSGAGGAGEGHRKTPSFSVITPEIPPMIPSKLAMGSHPYATSSSPTVDTFGVAGGLASGPQRNPTQGLAPINEDRGLLVPQGSNEIRDVGFKVGRGGFGRPTTPAGTVGVVAGTCQIAQQPTLDEVMRRTIKVTGDDGVTKTINVEGVANAGEVMDRVLKKFGRQAERSDDWGLYVQTERDLAAGRHGKHLDDLEIMTICRTVTRPERQKGLHLRRIEQGPRQAGQQKKLANFFGEMIPGERLPSSHSPTSPPGEKGYLVAAGIPTTSIEPASPTPSSGGQGSGDDPPNTPRESRQQQPVSAGGAGGGRGRAAAGDLAAQKRRNRASVVSVMSGLAVDSMLQSSPSGVGLPALPRSSGLFASVKGKLRNFSGHRPPSELISDHLVDFFPQVEKKKLSKTVRQSMRRSIALKRTSRFSDNWDGAGAGMESSRFSADSSGSWIRPNVPGRGVSPPTTSSSPRPSIDSARSMPPSINEPPADPDGPSSSGPPSLERTVSTASSRLSTLSAVGRRARDSDSASLLTVDEITAEVENRRLSGLIEDDDDAKSARRSIASLSPSPRGAIPEDEETDDDDDDDDDDEEEESDGDDDDDDDDDSDEQDGDDGDEVNDDPQKVTSKGGKSSIKWVRGALIGAGSFGSVYLGMHALNGTLMAVKQVERPTGSSVNEERKKNMITALEREIEFLKELQHPNIVQYFDSAGDEKFVNIFLEYVPGGSVSALLKNYGAFEEALVRTFTRQILEGLNYLHERDIIHRDIKGANILVDNKGVIKISDFGISKRVEDDLVPSDAGRARVHRPSLQGSVFWMAPEVVKQKSHTRKADIWSLGCLIVEMLTGEHPWPTLTQMQAIFRIGSGTARPEVPDDVSAECINILDQTFSIDHNARPTAKALTSHPFLVDPSQTPTRKSFEASAQPVAVAA